MPWVRFTEDFRYKPTAATCVAYKAGSEHLVKQDCADKAIAAKKAVLIQRRKVDGNSGR